MTSRLYFYGKDLGGTHLKSFDIGQGVEPVLTNRDVNANWVTSGAYQRLFVTDNFDFMIAASGSSGGWCFWTDPGDLASYQVISTPSFSGTVYCCGASASHMAIGGESSKLYVFDRTTLSFLTVDISALGTVYGMDFSPDGSKLAVYHSTSPYVSIYKTEDWSYIHTGAAAGSPNSNATIAFSSDSQRIIAVSNSSPYMAIFDATSGERLIANTSGSLWRGRGVVRINGKNQAWIIAGNELTGAIAYEYDAETNTQKLIVSSDSALRVADCAAIDEVEQKLYLAHAASSDRYVSIFNIGEASYSEEENIAGYGADNHLRQSVRATCRAMAIVKTHVHQLTGTVRDIDNLPAAREIRAYRRSDGQLCAITHSDAATGEYTLRLPDAGPYDIQFMTVEGELLNDLFYAKSEPQPLTN
jgi:hypothetical protein